MSCEIDIKVTCHKECEEISTKTASGGLQFSSNDTHSIDSFIFFIKRTALIEKIKAHVVIRLLGLLLLLFLFLLHFSCKTNEEVTLAKPSYSMIKLKRVNEQQRLPGASPAGAGAPPAAATGAAPPPAPTLQIRLPMSMLDRA